MKRERPDTAGRNVQCGSARACPVATFGTSQKVEVFAWRSVIIILKCDCKVSGPSGTLAPYLLTQRMVGIVDDDELTREGATNISWASRNSAKRLPNCRCLHAGNLAAGLPYATRNSGASATFIFALAIGVEEMKVSTVGN